MNFNKSINIIGAFDRYNYGDLLFPIIIKEYLKNKDPRVVNDYKIEVYGLVKSDLSKVGGLKTKSIKELYRNQITDGSLVIVAGGEVIGAKNSSLYMDLSKNKTSYFLKRAVRKILGNDFIEGVAKKKFGSYSQFPFVINKEDFKSNVLLTYNSVGARYLHNVSQDANENIIRCLKQSDYISVRENDSYNNVKKVHPNLFPDSASLVSEFFPLESLQPKITRKVESYVNSNPKYICIQTNLKVYKQHKMDFVDQINKIAIKQPNLNILLLPLGHAFNHDDGEALTDLKNSVNPEVDLITDINIYDTMFLIGNSMLFAGTSLHGNITASSYCVPHIGLSDKRPKLDSYLKAWDIDGQNHCIQISDLENKVIPLLDSNKELLINKREELNKLAHENFRLLFNVLE